MKYCEANLDIQCAKLDNKLLYTYILLRIVFWRLGNIMILYCVNKPDSPSWSMVVTKGV